MLRESFFCCCCCCKHWNRLPDLVNFSPSISRVLFFFSFIQKSQKEVFSKVFFSLPACRLSLWMGITWALCLMSWGIWCSSAVSGSPSTRSLTSPPCWRGSALWTGCSWPGTESKPWSSAACWGWVTSRTSIYGEPRARQGALFTARRTSVHLQCHWLEW